LKFAFLIFKYFPFGGMQRDMLRTVEKLVQRGHQVEIFAMRWEGDLLENITVHVLPQKGLFNYQRYQKFIDAAFRRIKQQNFDYIFGYNRMAGLDAHFAADPCYVERAHTQRSRFYRLLPRYKWFAACEKAVFSRDLATEVLAVSLTEKPHFQKWYGIQDTRYHYIPPYLSKERFADKSKVLDTKLAMRVYLREAFKFSPNDFVFLLTGSGFAMKGLDRAILALAALPQALRINTKLLAVGQDNPKKFLSMAAKLGITKNVMISKGRPDIPQLMQGADVAIHPAYRENTGLVILEAMACGAPLLVTESCGYASHVAVAGAGIVHSMPFDQARFNAEFSTMRTSSLHDVWANNGLDYIQHVMQANDGSAEANILINLANAKLKKHA
jgi:UDP-glucose:(heptosyl)LPS alpha-1,3-glucosyltransferase